MDFTFTEEQETVGKVARQLFEARATPERLTELGDTLAMLVANVQHAASH